MYEEKTIVDEKVMCREGYSVASCVVSTASSHCLNLWLENCVDKVLFFIVKGPSKTCWNVFMCV